MDEIKVIKSSCYGLILHVYAHSSATQFDSEGIDVNLEEFMGFSRIIWISTMETESIIVNCLSK